MESYEFCNLTELFLNNIENEAELIDVSRLLYKTQKAITQLPYIHKESEAVTRKNARIGQGVTGICQSLDKLDWLDNAYRALKAFDKEWSAERGWPISIKLTTIKPSGTLSLLAGATPGIHPAYAAYYIRRVRMASSDMLVDVLRSAGFTIEYARNFDGTLKRDTVVVEFPSFTPVGAKLAKDMTAIEQLELVKKLQTVWSDNAVSVTVYYRNEELDAIKQWLKMNYATSIKSVSFLLHSEHGFDQAPYEEIDADTYFNRVIGLKNINSSVNFADMLDNEDCATGACPVR